MTRLGPVEFAAWLEQRRERLVERWMSEVRSRDPIWDERQERLMERFFTLLVDMLPVSLGPYREQMEPLWLQAAELLGSVAAQRGLAAGEIIEEFQGLREALIRILYADPPSPGVPISLRDLLRLNRVIDRGVTQASVGHTDALFFSLFQGSGVPEPAGDALYAEVGQQLDQIRRDFDGVMSSLG